MCNRKSLVSLIGLFCLFTAASVSAQPRWGRDRQPQAGACFYENSNFRGRYFCVRPGERLQSLPNRMGDEISSVRILGSSEVTVFRDSNMRGRSARFIGDVRDLRGEGWNDQISSLDVGTGRDYSGFGSDDRRGNRNRGANNGGGWRGNRLPVWGRNQAMPRDGACFYEDADFRGQYFCAPRGATYDALPRGFNDRISSVRVFGGEVRLFQSENFRGRSTQLKSDVPNLRGNWKDKVSSIRIF